MGTIQGLTKDRMLAIEAASVTTGHVDGNGDLILTTHGGVDIDAGHVQAPNLADATVTTKGIAELATLAEVSAGLDSVRIVTPEGVRQERDRVSVYGGVIDPTWSSGRPMVTLNAGGLLGGTVVQCLLPYDTNDQGIMPGGSVLVTRTVNGTWVILQSYSSSPRFMKQLALTLEPGTGWFLYTDPVSTDPYHQYGEGPAGFGGWYAANINTGAGNAYLTCTSTGIVSVGGLLCRVGGTPPASNSVIARFPIALAPTRNQTFVVNAAGATGNVAVCTDGTIRFLYGTNVGYFSIDNLRWRTAASVTAGTATFVPLSLNSGFAAFNGAAWGGEPGSTIHTPGYTIDADKVCIFEGQVQATSSAAVNANISTISGLTPAPGIHCLSAYSGVAFGFVRIGASAGAAGSGNILNIGTAIGASSVCSLANILWVDSTSPTVARVVPGFQNAWQGYPAAFAQPTFGKTPDGLCIAFGLYNNGTVTTAMTRIPQGWRPRFASIQAVVSNAAIGRLDVGFYDPGSPKPSRAVLPNGGSNVWFSLDGISWPAYE